jgi:hypothetical protein
MAKTSKTTRRPVRNAKVAPKVRKVVNPFSRTYDGKESKSAILFNALSHKYGADLRDIAEQIDSSLATVRVRLSQLGKQGFTIEKIGERGEPVYRLVA